MMKTRTSAVTRTDDVAFQRPTLSAVRMTLMVGLVTGSITLGNVAGGGVGGRGAGGGRGVAGNPINRPDALALQPIDGIDDSGETDLWVPRISPIVLSRGRGSAQVAATPPNIVANSRLPLLHKSSIVYQGAFRVPNTGDGDN